MATCNERKEHPDPASSLRLAVAQVASVAGDIEANLATVQRYSRNASREGAQLIVFPEKFLTGYEPQLLKKTGDAALIKPGDAALETLARISEEQELTLIVGAPTLIDGVRRISSIIANADGSIGFYHKQHLFYSEKDWYSPGCEDKSILIGGWKIGLGICYDSGFPEHARRVAADGCDVYLVSALFGRTVGRQELSVWMPARALDNTIYVVTANYCGTTGGWEACGRSGVWSPMGECIAQAGEDDSELLVVLLQSDAIRHARESEHMLRDYRAIYG
ncbi:carbon-nitrogen hydrolase family protein [Herbaspirillum sp. SJZ099]|uniref:carbon-nitrogen hydrolase family protein n=1 Tax=Herbaspirillum sp. SJZ099 TaxID=2572916 RepID=UPI0011ADEF06|nr:carbon-nitrogen hydrolase family protein [Herbaspirillum sp. SJZ099]TWC69448.1 putative amidohydrolase [Herbaspirillum sp. SJZ099]